MTRVNGVGKCREIIYGFCRSKLSFPEISRAGPRFLISLTRREMAIWIQLITGHWFLRKNSALSEPNINVVYRLFDCGCLTLYWLVEQWASRACSSDLLSLLMKTTATVSRHEELWQKACQGCSQTCTTCDKFWP